MSLPSPPGGDDIADLYPEIEPYEHGVLEVGDGNALYWEAVGNPHGKPAVMLHGGPGSGCSPGFRRLFDPARYRAILFDQRNCGRSTPHAADPSTDLASNTTQHLLADVERLREHLGIERWLVVGGSWGSTLALAYAEKHAARVSEVVLFGVTTGRHEEADWTFRGGLARFFPGQWERLLAALPEPERSGDVVEAYARLLNDPDPNVCRRAAEAWCTWESATPAWPPREGLEARFEDPRFALAFARIVTHYISHNAWLEDGVLLEGAGALADIPAVMINGRYDLQAPVANAWALRRAMPRAELVIVDNAGHTGNPELTRAIVAALDRFAART